MNNTDDTQHPATDDPELAKVLNAADNSASSGLQFEESPVPTTDTPAPTSDDATDSAAVAVDDTPPVSTITPEPAFEVPSLTDPVFASTDSGTQEPTGELAIIKKDALQELRPLVDHLELPADEKFDILLLIIRSTDDNSLVAAAHEAAKAIEDESKRAAALLDIIKEIDYFSTKQ